MTPKNITDWIAAKLTPAVAQAYQDGVAAGQAASPDLQAQLDAANAKAADLQKQLDAMAAEVTQDNADTMTDLDAGLAAARAAEAAPPA